MPAIAALLPLAKAAARQALCLYELGSRPNSGCHSHHINAGLAESQSTSSQLLS